MTRGSMPFAKAFAGGNAIATVLALLLASTLFVAPVSARAEIVLPNGRGGTLSLAASPQRVVSLLPSLTESICALGGCERLVGTDRYSNWPTSVQALPKLGGLDDALIERIVSLKPDVVLAAPSQRVIDRLESLGLQVLVIETRTHAEVRTSLQTLAGLLGMPEQAALVWAAIEHRLRDATQRVPPRLRGMHVYFEIDGAPYAAGATSFIGETLARLGLDNIVPPALGPFPKLNPEYVVRARPDIVMAGDRSIEEMPRRPGWSALTALQAHRVCGFDAAQMDVLVRPGPRMGEGALRIADCLAAWPKTR